jgi:hypothetical protein
MPLFDQLGEKALDNFVPEYLVLELSTRQIYHRQGRSRSPSIYSLPKYSGAAAEDWYPGYLHGLKRPKEGFAMTQPTIQKIPRDCGVLPKA